LIYRSKDPAVVGFGFLTVRDTGAWLRHATAADGNPCAGTLDRAYVFGVSQSGRFLRHFLYLALNEDERGRRVFDAVWPHAPGALPPPAEDPNTGGRGRHRFNVVDYAPLLRAALVNLDRWVKRGIEPPPSAVPRLADLSAVPHESVEKVFTAIPDARFPDHIE